MAIKITDDCINCAACEPECPNGASYPNAVGWRFSDKTDLSGMFTAASGIISDADEEHQPLSNDFFYIVPDKCTECVGFHEKPQCASVCPVDCCVPDPDHAESEEELLGKMHTLHS